MTSAWSRWIGSVLVRIACSVILLASFTALGLAQEMMEDPAIFARPDDSSAQTHQLKGGITKLEAAIEQERGSVDWYAWYLAARKYIAVTGGLNCSLGTELQFNKNGAVDARSTDPACIISARSKWFPLPNATKLPAIILTTRSRLDPPATPEEIHRRTSQRERD